MSEYKKSPPKYYGVHADSVECHLFLALFEIAEIINETDSKKLTKNFQKVQNFIRKAWDLVPEEKKE